MKYIVANVPKVLQTKSHIDTITIRLSSELTIELSLESKHRNVKAFNLLIKLSSFLSLSYRFTPIFFLHEFIIASHSSLALLVHLNHQ